jgi:hypothetical protein
MVQRAGLNLRGLRLLLSSMKLVKIPAVSPAFSFQALMDSSGAAKAGGRRKHLDLRL